jgi:CRISPR-associated exonuclease Cas4
MDATAPAGQVSLTVTDIKQWLYCRRIVFHTYLLGIPRPRTIAMDEGSRAQEDAEALERRRTLRSYGLADGERRFDLAAISEQLGLGARLDLLIVREHEAIPVDFKDSRGPVGRNHAYQLAAYALIAEETAGRPVRRGFIYLIQARRAVEVLIRPGMRRYVRRAVAEIGAMLANETLPPPTRHRSRCTDCEFRRFCNDVD